MSNVDFDWVRSQFDKANVRIGVGVHVLQLLSKWEELQVPEQDAAEVLRVLTEVAQGHALVEETEGRWVDATPGLIFTGDTVRVKNDAFSGEAGVMHNGRVGRVVAVRYGDVIMRSTDSGNLIDGAHYSPHLLQKRVG